MEEATEYADNVVLCNGGDAGEDAHVPVWMHVICAKVSAPY